MVDYKSLTPEERYYNLVEMCLNEDGSPVKKLGIGGTIEEITKKAVSSSFIFAVKAMIKCEPVLPAIKECPKVIARYMYPLSVRDPLIEQTKRVILSNARKQQSYPIVQAIDTIYAGVIMHHITNGLDSTIVESIYAKFCKVTNEDIDLILLNNDDRVYDNNLHEAYYRKLQEVFPNYFVAMKAIGIRERDIMGKHKEDATFANIYATVKAQKIMEIDQAQYKSAAYDKSIAKFLLGRKTEKEVAKKQTSSNLRDIILGNIMEPEFVVKNDTTSIDARLD